MWRLTDSGINSRGLANLMSAWVTFQTRTEGSCRGEKLSFTISPPHITLELLTQHRPECASVFWMASQGEWPLAADKVNCHYSAPITAPFSH